MTVLGTGGYNECTYVDFDKKNKIINASYNTKFAQVASFSFFCGDYKDGDRFTVFVTSGARKKHLADFERDVKKVFEGRNIIFEAVDILEGLSPDEQWKNFNIIYDTISEGETVTADITHGFRILPMQLFAILNYAENLKKISVSGVYYGVFEQPFGRINDEFIPYGVLSDYYNKEEKTYAEGVEVFYPVVDYSGYLTIMNLSNAAFCFSETGDAGAFAESVQKSKIKQFTVKETSDEIRKEYSKLYQFGVGLKNITESIRCVRGRNDEKASRKDRPEKSIYQAVKCYEEAVRDQTISPDESSEAKALLNIITYMDGIVRDKFGKITGTEVTDEADKNISTGLCVIEWCIKYDMIQAGFTALEETVITWLVKNFGEYIRKLLKEERSSGTFIERDVREKAGSIATCYSRNFKDDGCAEDDIGNKRAQDELKIYNAFLSEFRNYRVEEIFDIILKIKQSRNDMNHFGFSTDQRKSSSLRKQLKEYYDAFSSIMASPFKDEGK